MRVVLITIFLFSSCLVRARILTVSNTNLFPAQYNSFNAAGLVAQEGDTIYLAPGGGKYSVRLDASYPDTLTLIGYGYFDPKFAENGNILTTRVDRNFLVSNSSGVYHLIGLVFDNENRSNSPSGMNASRYDNLEFLRCRFVGSIYFRTLDSSPDDSVLFRDCVFTERTGTLRRDNGIEFDNGHLAKITFRNCIFSKNVFLNIEARTSRPRVLMQNCLFLGGADSRNVTVNGSGDIDFVQCVFDNRQFPSDISRVLIGLSLLEGTNAASVSGITLTSPLTGAIDLQAPPTDGFTNTPLVDYRLVNQPPEANNYTIGITDQFNVFGQPPIPYIQELGTPNGVLPQDSTLVIQITGKNQN